MAVESQNRAWQRSLVALASVAVFTLIVVALYWARSVFLPVAFAIFLAFVLSPVVQWLRRRGIGQVPAVLATVTMAGCAFTLTFALIGWQLSELSQKLPDKAPQIKAKLLNAKRDLFGDGENRFGNMANDIASTFSPPPPLKDEKATTVIVDSSDSWLTQVPAFLSPTLEVFGQGAFSLVLAVFMLFKKNDLRNRLIRLIGDTRVTTANKAVDDATKRISRYLLMQLFINTTFGVLIIIALLSLSIPYALLWGFVASVMRYIPYLGTWLGLIPPLAVAWIFTDTWWQPAGVLTVYAVLELACNNFIEPRLYGKSMGLSEVAQLIAAAFWTLLWGPVGLVLSGPLTVCLLVLGKNVPSLRFLDILLGDEPALSADVRFYQRITARDQDEATEIVVEELKTRPTVEVFDRIVVPALTYAKRDAERNEHTAPELAGMLHIVREIVDDLGDLERERHVAATEVEPRDEKVRVLIVPARDEADQVGIEMLREVLDARLWEVDVSPVAQLTSEILSRAESFDPAVIVVGSLPPGGLAHTRYVCKRIARQFPDARIVVGRWGVSEDTNENRTQLIEAGAAHETSTIAETVSHLNAWLAALGSKQKAAEKADEAVILGTTTANTLVV